jgi:hypothetical protein
VVVEDREIAQNLPVLTDAPERIEGKASMPSPAASKIVLLKKNDNGQAPTANAGGSKKVPGRRKDGASGERNFLTQAEVADRFRVSVATVITWRKKGIMGYFQAPGSTKILYPVSAIEAFEQRFYRKTKAEEVVQKKKESPEVPTRPKQVWRI